MPPTTALRHPAGATELRRPLSAIALLLLVLSALGVLFSPGAIADEVGVEENDFYVAGNVRHEGKPLNDVRLVVTGGDYEAEVLTDENGKWKVGVPTKDPYDVLLDEETLPEGIAVEGQNPITSQFGAQNFRPVNFYIGVAERETASFLSQLGDRLVNGVNFGLMLALAAIGLNLVFGTTGLSNFAHAEMVTFGAVMTLAFTAFAGWPLWVAIPIALVLCAGLGWAIDAGIWRPLRGRGIGIVQMMILTIGLSLAGRYVFQYFIGGGTYQLPGASGVQMDILGIVRLSWVDIISMGISVVALAVVAWWLLFTKVGKATRAVSDNRALAAASGIDVERVVRLVWIIAAVLAGLAGILWAYFRPGIKWDMGMQILLLMFAAVCLGGLGTAFGALVGALIVGILVETSTLWIPSDLKYVGALAVLVVILLLRPQGILGKRERIG